jgi:hypothetical protein
MSGEMALIVRLGLKTVISKRYLVIGFQIGCYLFGGSATDIVDGATRKRTGEGDNVCCDTPTTGLNSIVDGPSSIVEGGCIDC